MGLLKLFDIFFIKKMYHIILVGDNPLIKK